MDGLRSNTELPLILGSASEKCHFILIKVQKESTTVHFLKGGLRQLKSPHTMGRNKVHHQITRWRSCVQAFPTELCSHEKEKSPSLLEGDGVAGWCEHGGGKVNHQSSRCKALFWRKKPHPITGLLRRKGGRGSTRQGNTLQWQGCRSPKNTAASNKREEMIGTDTHTRTQGRVHCNFFSVASLRLCTNFLLSSWSSCNCNGLRGSYGQVLHRLGGGGVGGSTGAHICSSGRLHRQSRDFFSTQSLFTSFIQPPSLEPHFSSQHIST